MRKTLSFGLVVLAWLGAVAAPASAQGVAQTFTELRLLIREGDTVAVASVKDDDVVRGRVESLTATSLVLARGGRLQTLSEADVVTIRQRRGDSLSNGALIGLAAGLGTVLVGAAILASGSEEVDGGGVAILGALYGGAGAGIGAGIDALITREYVIFERPRSARLDVRIAPMLTHGVRGIGVTIAF